MDTLTQAALGAAVGLAGWRSHGRRALLFGAFCGLLPDLDVLLSLGQGGDWRGLVTHRGCSHSVLVLPLVALPMGWAGWRLLGRRGRWQSWVHLAFWALITHPLLDAFTTYGTQLFTPLSNKRFALHAVPIIDPLYSMILIAALAVWIGVPPGKRTRLGKRAAVIVLVVSTAYLFYGLWLNVRAEQEVQRQLAAEDITHARVRVYPTILQVYLRRVVARVDNEVFVGSITMWKPGPVLWHRFTIPEHPMVDKLVETREGRIFVWFAGGEVVPRVIELNNSVLVELEDLRYGFFEEPDQGIWGIRGTFDLEGRLQGEVVRFQRQPDVKPETFLNLWRAAFGLIPEIPGSGLSEGLRGQGVGSGKTRVSKES